MNTWDRITVKSGQRHSHVVDTKTKRVILTVYGAPGGGLTPLETSLPIARFLAGCIRNELRKIYGE